MNPDDVDTSPVALRPMPAMEDLLPVAAWTGTLGRELADMHEAFRDLPHPLEWCEQVDDQAQVLAFSAVHALLNHAFQAALENRPKDYRAGLVQLAAHALVAARAGLSPWASDGIRRAWLARGLGLDDCEGWWQHALRPREPDAENPLVRLREKEGEES